MKRMNALAPKNYYEILGLSHDCTLQEIKKNYHQLALIWHPDKHDDKKEAELKFTFINEAYTVLSDENQRNLYDQQRQRALDLEQKLKEFSNEFNTNAFSVQQFANIDQSALDILKDILEDKDDSNLVADEDKIPDGYKGFKSIFKTFINQEVISSDDDYMFGEYQPTFMDKRFSNDYNMYNKIYQTKDNSTQYFATIIEDLPKLDLNDPPLRRRKSSIIIIEKSETKDNSENSRGSGHQKSSRVTTFKLNTGLKRPFIYNEELDNFEEQPQKKVKRPILRPRAPYINDLSSNEDEPNFNLKSIFEGISMNKKPITTNLSLHELRMRLQSQH